ncbi:hypothetical protein JCM10908_004609 [Rhodotorula pacifica]|uniref:U2-type spliceosomal complex subunit CWC21 n=1 Tax=Rhodotorula pacifica TaxID=1495444 RepID=UPI00316C86F4
MSYNNIGLSTPRGSGTSGHIQANRSAIRQRDRPRDSGPSDLHRQSLASRAPDQAILEHERKRAIEAKCFELQVSLEDDGVNQDEIDSQVAALRERLTAQQQQAGSTAGGPIKAHERHQLAEAKQQADSRMRKALGIKDDFVEGASFDRELQEQLKQQRQAERERAREERAKIEEELKKERARAQALRDAQRQRHEEEMARERRRQQDELEQSRRDHAARLRSVQGAGAGTGAKSAAEPAARLPYGGGGGDNNGARGRSLSRSPPPRAAASLLAFSFALSVAASSASLSVFVPLAIQIAPAPNAQEEYEPTASSAWRRREVPHKVEVEDEVPFDEYEYESFASSAAAGWCGKALTNGGSLYGC